MDFPPAPEPFFYRLIVYYDFPSSNEWLGDKRKYENWKSDLTFKIKRVAQQQLAGVQIHTWCGFYFAWYMKNERKDPPNVWMNQKAVFDGLVNAKVLKDDTYQYTKGGCSVHTDIDPKQPRLEILIYPEVMMNTGTRAIHRNLAKRNVS